MVTTGALVVVTVAVFGLAGVGRAVQVSQVAPGQGGIAGGETVTIDGDFRLAAPTTLQAVTQEYCASLPVYDGTNQAAIVTLNDPRGDGQQYQVAKLADNNCWTLNNLKLGSTTGTITLTPADSNVTADWVLPQVGLSGTNYHNSPIVDSPGSGSSDILANTFYGYYYNWCAATAGVPSASAGQPGYTCTASSTMPDDAVQDICPAGWRLPVGGVSGNATNEFSNLNARMAGFVDDQDPTYQASSNFYDNWVYDSPIKGVFAGHRSGALWSNVGVNGRYWSSSHHSSAGNAYTPIFSATSIAVSNNTNRSFRISVRCTTPGGTLAPTVTVGGVPATVTAWDETSMTIVTPAHAAGLVDVVVARGSESFALSGGYEYIDPNAPVTPPVVPSAPSIVPGAPNTGRGL